MLGHEVNKREKEDGNTCIIAAAVVPAKMDCADFMGWVETRVITNNIEKIF